DWSTSPPRDRGVSEYPFGRVGILNQSASKLFGKLPHVETPMAERRRSSSWLQVSWRSQPDGRFLIRPLGASPLVFLADAPTKERLVRFVRAYHAWQFWILLLSGLVALPVMLAFFQHWFWWVLAADFGLCYLLTL